MEIMEITIKIICEKICNPQAWRYEGSMQVLGKKIFLTFGDSVADVKRTALRRLKTLLLKTNIPD
jgi:hypothetical protein